jgi:hypothetical protein
MMCKLGEILTAQEGAPSSVGGGVSGNNDIWSPNMFPNSPNVWFSNWNAKKLKAKYLGIAILLRGVVVQRSASIHKCGPWLAMFPPFPHHFPFLSLNILVSCRSHYFERRGVWSSSPMISLHLTRNMWSLKYHIAFWTTWAVALVLGVLGVFDNDCF